MKLTAATIAIAAGTLTLAACSSSAPSASPTLSASTPARTTSDAPPSASTNSSTAPASRLPAGVSIAPGGTMAAGPMTITPTYCGKFTTAQQQQYGTTATGGLIYRFTNASAALTAAPKLSVNFLDGATVVGNNVSADPTPVAPGQSGAGEVDAAGGSGQNLTFGGCQIMLYYVVTSTGIVNTPYAG